MNFSKCTNLHWKAYSIAFEKLFSSFSLPSCTEPSISQNLRVSSAVYSANIEGNSLDLNSFSNAKHFGTHVAKPKEHQEIEDLIEAYQYSEHSMLNKKNMLHSHALAMRHLLPTSQCGKYREHPVGVFGKEGLVYLAVEWENIHSEMNILFEEIMMNISDDLSPQKAFFLASYSHLRFVHIHPFSDGNGRMARILEKWILATCLGNNAWNLQTEHIYKEQRNEYYEAIALGVNFYELDYTQAFRFLSMLPKSFSSLS